MVCSTPTGRSGLVTCAFVAERIPKRIILLLRICDSALLYEHTVAPVGPRVILPLTREVQSLAATAQRFISACVQIVVAPESFAVFREEGCTTSSDQEIFTWRQVADVDNAMPTDTELTVYPHGGR